MHTEEMLNRFRKTGTTDPERCDKYIDGLLKPIMAKVLMQNPTTTEQAETGA